MFKLSLVFSAIVILFWCALSLPAQTAKVIALSPADAAYAKSLNEQKEALDKKVADLREKIVRVYLTASPTDSSGWVLSNGSGLRIKTGWGLDFLYDEDYKFIVPRPSSLTFTIGPSCPTFNWGSNMLVAN